MRSGKLEVGCWKLENGNLEVTKILFVNKSLSIICLIKRLGKQENQG